MLQGLIKSKLDGLFSVLDHVSADRSKKHNTAGEVLKNLLICTHLIFFVGPVLGRENRFILCLMNCWKEIVLYVSDFIYCRSDPNFNPKDIV